MVIEAILALSILSLSPSTLQGSPTPPVSPSPAVTAERAEQIARANMPAVIGADAVRRSDVEVRPAPGGWIVIFHDARASCAEGYWWPGACTHVAFGTPASFEVYRDVYTCVNGDGMLYGFSASFRPVGPGEEQRCGRPPASPISPPPGPPGVTPVSGAPATLPPTPPVRPSAATPVPPGNAQRIAGEQPTLSPLDVPVVPEAATLFLALGGLFVVAGLRWWRP